MIINRKIVIIVAMITLAISAWAMPARPGRWKVITLADGTQVRVELKGDEHCSFWQSAEGKCYRMADAKKNVYAEVDHELLIEQAMDSRMAQKVSDEVNRRGVNKILLGDIHPEYVGSRRCLCLLVEYPNKKFEAAHTPEVFKDVINKVGYTNSEYGHIGSVRDYFLNQSGGVFDIEFDVVGPLMLSHDYEYYGGHSTTGANDARAGEMITEAVNLANPIVDFKQYDWDDDGVCESIYVLYAGQGEADSDDPNTIWPHKSTIFNVKCDKVRITDYACGPELDEHHKLNGIGTMCHEFSHCLGLPDMYDVDYRCNEYGTSYWDVMDMGSYNGNGFMPAMYNAYERWYCGWLQPTELIDEQHIEGMKALTSGGECYIVRNDACEDEYFLLENRQLESFDAGLPGTGMLVYHVDFDASAWALNLVNCSYRKEINTYPRFVLLCADNSKNDRDFLNISHDAWPYENNTVLSDLSLPSTALNHRNSEGNTKLGKSFCNIERGADGTINFDFKLSVVESGIRDVGVSQSAVTYDLAGRKVATPSLPGIYITSGKKVLK